MNIRPANKDDDDFLKTMLYEAARWNPDWPAITCWRARGPSA